MTTENQLFIKKYIAVIKNLIIRYPLIAVTGTFFIGILLIPITDEVDAYFSTDQFCANSCHEMQSTVSKEFMQSTHGMTETGVRPSCADCHVSKNLTVAMWDHFIGTKELIVHLTTDVSEPGGFEKFRTEAANRVRLDMLDNDSKYCRSCHVMEAIKPKRQRGKKQHANAIKDNTTCIACHYNLVHKEVEPSEEFLERIN